jgi:hypothetical protein
MFSPASSGSAVTRFPLPALLVLAACGGSDARLEPRYVAVHNTLTTLGLAQTGPISQGSLGQGDDVRVVVPLRGNECTVFLALGSDGVSDVDLVVLDENGATLAEDDTSDRQAAVRVCPMRGGDHAVVLRAAEGSGGYTLASWSTGEGAGGGAGVLAAAGGQPGTCAAPLPLSLGQPSTGSTEGGSADLEPTCAAGQSSERVYVVEVEERAQLNVVLESEYDGVLYLQRTCGDQRSEVTCNDDSPQENTRRSEIDATVDPGRYFVVVDGYGGEVGNYQLLATANPLRPLAEVCDDAETIAPGQVVSGATTTGADYFQASCAGGARSPDRVYALDVRQPSRLRVRQQSDHDGALHLRRVCDEPTSELVCNDDFVDQAHAHVRARVEPGRYFLIADGYGEGAAGAFSFTADLEPADGSGGPGDTCADPQMLAPGGLGSPTAPSTAPVDTIRLRDDLSGTCGEPGGPDAVFQLDVPSRGILSASLRRPEFRGALYLRRGRCDDRSGELACTAVEYAAGGELRALVQPGRHYLIVDGDGVDQFGAAELSVALEDLRAAERACRQATRLRPGREVSASTSGADSLFTASCAERAASPEKLYRLRITRRSRVRLAVSSEYDAAIHVRSDCADPASEVACNDDHEDNRHALVEQELDPGTYTVFVDGFREGNEGSFTLDAEVTPL